ncbi:transporter [uncultured Sphingomonas sp.]|uniref:transporter n=1 Tax=uncultured Sphingomonas sp. TaxID=158754 RepID=UPI0035C9D9C3
MTIRWAAPVAAIALSSMAGTAVAQATDAGDQPSTPAPTPICTDRPTKANVACTVPAGAIQIEADVLNWTRLDAPGAQVDTILYGNPTLKYGLGATTDVEVNLAPYETVRTRAQGASDTIGGVGDLYIRLKQQLTRPSAPVQVAVIPYVKAPTARTGVGNGKVEGGVIAPIVFDLPAGFTLDLGPEVDILANGEGRGHHVQLVGLVNLSKTVGRTTLYGEMWTGQNHDPAATVRQYSADVAVTYLLTPTLQLDVGANFGLNRVTPDVQSYLGIAARF